MIEEGRQWTATPETNPEDAGALSHAEILAQLDRITQSPHFKNSKRYPALLSFIVRATLEGRTEELKERTLGVAVFGRELDYDTSTDPVVRLTAGEVRKRIAQYYHVPGHEHEIRFELPLGSYIPHFQRAAPPSEAASVSSSAERVAASVEPILATPAEVEPAALPVAEPTPEVGARKWPFVAAAALLLILVAAALFWHRQTSEAELKTLWEPWLQSAQPSQIVLGVHTFDLEGKDLSPELVLSDTGKQSMLNSMLRSNMVPVSDVASYGLLTSVLARNSHAFNTHSATETRLEQLRGSPVILLGAFDNVWTMRLTQSLRFHFATESDTVHDIVDKEHPTARWSFDSSQSASTTSRDYALVAAYYSPEIEQPVLVVAGIGKGGTEAAAEFVSSQADIENWLKRSPLKGKKNVEVVLSADIIGNQHGPPRVEATYAW